MAMSTKVGRVFVALSGGVDSSVALHLLKKKGFDVHGIYMQNWDDRDEVGFCRGAIDAEDAEWVCKKLEVPFHYTNFTKEYWNNVFSDLVNDYTSGLTPNPDILCNKHIKFNSLFNHIINKLGGDVIATGHYARTSYGDFLHHSSSDDVKLLLPNDLVKDQTFFLSQVSQDALRRTMFPVGSLLKQEVRVIAQQNGLERIIKKKESMGICFIGSRHFQSFISEYVPPLEGNFIDIESGEVLEKHKGIHNWTIGQRCRISGMATPRFVVRKCPLSQDILVAPGTDHPALYSRLFYTSSPHWIDPNTRDLIIDSVLDCSFRFQNTHMLSKCKISLTSKNNLIVQLDNYLRALTPGQFAVFYKDGECLGSARIKTVGASLYELGGCNAQDSIITDNNMKQKLSASNEAI